MLFSIFFQLFAFTSDGRDLTSLAPWVNSVKVSEGERDGGE